MDETPVSLDPPKDVVPFKNLGLELQKYPKSCQVWFIEFEKPTGLMIENLNMHTI